MNKSITGYGLDYESPIGEIKAKRLIGNQALPRMGYEVDVKIVQDSEYGLFKLRLAIQNISGQLVLTSTNVIKSEWGNVFGIEP